jgi:hypothetical protein
MKFRVAQLSILSVFMTCLLVDLTLIAVSYGRNAIYSDNFKDLSVRFLVIYSIPLGITISGILGKGISAARMAPKGAFWVAVALAIAWNVPILARTIMFTFSADDRVASLTDYIDAVASAGSFLTASALTYFFAAEQGASRVKQEK